MSDTPRTDAVNERMMVLNTTSYDAYLEMRLHAETAEREFEEVRKHLWSVTREGDELKQQRDEWRACAEGLAAEVNLARFRELDTTLTSRQIPLEMPARKKHDDGNSEESLIRLIRGILGGFETRLTSLEATTRKLMTAIEDLQEAVNANVAGQAVLTTAVNAAIVRLATPSPTDAVLQTLRAQVQSSTDSDAALTTSLNAALAAPATPA